MVASLLKLAGLDRAVPDYTTLCRRQKTLAVQIGVVAQLKLEGCRPLSPLASCHADDLGGAGG